MGYRKSKCFIVTNPKDILINTCRIAGVPLDDVKTKYKGRTNAEVRMAYFIVASQLTDKSQSDIAMLVKRERTAVIYGLKNAHIPEIKMLVNKVLNHYKSIHIN